MVQEFAIGILAIAADFERAEYRVRIRLPAETRSFSTIDSCNTNRGYSEAYLHRAAGDVYTSSTHQSNLTQSIIPTCIS